MHEFGHNLAARHDANSSPGGFTPWNHNLGFVDHGDYQTIMGQDFTVADTPMLEVFSTDAARVDADRPGNANADNAQAVHDMRIRIRDYRDTRVSGPANFLHLLNFGHDGVHDLSFAYGAVGDKVIFCDWDGDGVDTPGLFRNNVWHLRNSNTSGGADIPTFSFGSPTDTPICGDWDGDGDDTIGVWRAPNEWYLRNTNTTGNPDWSFSYGGAGDTPVWGQFTNCNVNAPDTVGVLRSGRTWLLRTASGGGATNLTITYGSTAGTDTAFMGRWGPDQCDDVGVRRGNQFLLRNSLNAGPADRTYSFGTGNDLAVRGHFPDTQNSAQNELREPRDTIAVSRYNQSGPA